LLSTLCAIFEFLAQRGNTRAFFIVECFG